MPPEADENPLPTEFLIFKGPLSTSENGDVLYDAAAASSVREHWLRHWGRLDGHDLMIDLDHAALFQPSADAMGWAKIGFRGTDEAPELWAEDVKWTEEGARRLRSRSQRYMSPMFGTRGAADGKTPPSVTKLVNVALTALPASDGLDALMAASQFAGRQKAKADPLGPKTRSMDTSIDQAKLAEALGLNAEATPEDVFAVLQALVDRMSKDMGDDAAPASEPEAVAASTESPEDMTETKAAKLLVLGLTGEKHILPAVNTIERWKAAFVEQEASKAALAKDRAKLERAERRSIGATLVGAGLSPAMVWADDSASDLAPALANQPIEELRAYAKKASGQPVSRSTSIPSAPAADRLELSVRELSICKETGVDPAVYAKNKATREAARTR